MGVAQGVGWVVERHTPCWLVHQLQLMQQHEARVHVCPVTCYRVLLCVFYATCFHAGVPLAEGSSGFTWDAAACELVVHSVPSDRPFTLQAVTATHPERRTGLDGLFCVGGVYATQVGQGGATLQLAWWLAEGVWLVTVCLPVGDRGGIATGWCQCSWLAPTVVVLHTSMLLSSSSNA